MAKLVLLAAVLAKVAATTNETAVTTMMAATTTMAMTTMMTTAMGTTAATAVATTAPASAATTTMMAATTTMAMTTMMTTMMHNDTTMAMATTTASATDTAAATTTTSGSNIVAHTLTRVVRFSVSDEQAAAVCAAGNKSSLQTAVLHMLNQQLNASGLPAVEASQVTGFDITAGCGGTRARRLATAIVVQYTILAASLSEAQAALSAIAGADAST